MDYLLNFSLILFVLWTFYKLLLENTSWHHFKRIYLLASVIVAAVIPLIVVRTVLIPAVTIDPQLLIQYNLNDTTAASEGTSLDLSFWITVIYVLGVLIMSLRFLRNLNRLRISPTDDLEHYQTYQLVLRDLVAIPHSFINRIYADRKEYRSGHIPEIVLEHEKAHLDQRHSWDILFIELLLIVLWFNPLVYVLKFSIKLNHEFLADESVLRTGLDTRYYQRTLLAFAASDSYKTIANTFNFPIIKKRFTIMNTKTSPTSLLLRSIALIPVLALLIISCGKEEVVEKPETLEIIEVVEGNWEDPKLLLIDSSKNSGTVTLIDGTIYNYKITNGKAQFFDITGKLWDFEKEGYKTVSSKNSVDYIDLDYLKKNGLIDDEIEIIEVLEEVTADDIADYNRLAKKHKEYIDKNKRVMVWNNETQRMQTIWNSMNAEQKAENEPWPFTGTFYNVEYKDGQIPPPPPPAPAMLTIDKNSGFIKVDENIMPYSSKGNGNTYFDHDGKLIDTKGKTVEEIDSSDVPPPPPAKKKSDDATGFNTTQKSVEVSDWVADFEKSYKKNGQAKVGGLEDWRTIDYFVIDQHDVSLINTKSND